MPAQLTVLEKYVNGKKYKHEAEWYSYDFSKYKAFYIFPGRQPRTMYCQVTKMTLNQIPSEIENHIHGRRYIAAKVAYEAQLERTKAANARRDEKQRQFKAKGVKPDRHTDISDEDLVEADDNDALPVILDKKQQGEKKKAWHEDLSDLYPTHRSDDQEEAEDDIEDGGMEFLSDLAESDEDEEHTDSDPETVTLQAVDDDPEDSPREKPKKRDSKRSSTKDSAKRSRERSGDKTKARAQELMSEAIDDSLKPKHAKIKHRSKHHK